VVGSVVLVLLLATALVVVPALFAAVLLSVALFVAFLCTPCLSIPHCLFHRIRQDDAPCCLFQAQLAGYLVASCIVFPLALATSPVLLLVAGWIFMLHLQEQRRAARRLRVVGGAVTVL
jgi:hypothetical protein